MSIQTDLEYARELDRQDELAGYRNAFVIDDPDLIYLDGNSLGRLPQRSVVRAREAIEDEWGRRLIRGWNDCWFTMPQRLGAKIARLIGAGPDEVVVTDSTSVNMFKLVVAALGARPGRHKIVTDELNFPSDLYILQGAIKLAGPDYRLEIVRSTDGMTVSDADLAAAFDADTALVSLTHTTFKSGYVYDMNTVTEMAHRTGALVLWDLSHSVGAMPLALSACGVDLAVGCTYKYLCGGPGAPSFVYVRRDLQCTLENPIWGWFGQRDQFQFATQYQPGPGIQRFLVGTPPVISLAAVEPGLDLVLEAGLDRIRAKSVRQTEYLVTLWQALLEPLGITLNSPREPARRGSHVSLGHPEGLRVAQALIDRQHVVPDFRRPDNIRFGISPLYTTYAEIHAAAAALRTVVKERIYEQYDSEQLEVT